jgi:hypothetical protein
LVRLAPPSPQCNPIPTPLEAIARGFIILFHVCIWNPSTIVSLHLLGRYSATWAVPPPLSGCLWIYTGQCIFLIICGNNLKPGCYSTLGRIFLCFLLSTWELSKSPSLWELEISRPSDRSEGCGLYRGSPVLLRCSPFGFQPKVLISFLKSSFT